MWGCRAELIFCTELGHFVAVFLAYHHLGLSDTIVLLVWAICATVSALWLFSRKTHFLVEFLI